MSHEVNYQLVNFTGALQVVDCLMNSAHFLPNKTTYDIGHLAKEYVDEIVWLHGVPMSIISDHDPHFTS
jgi:hypothetical protein